MADDAVLASIRFDADARPDPDVRITSRVLYQDPTGAFRTGFWAAPPGPPAPIAYSMDEFCVLLEGSVQVTDAAGRVAVYRQGDSFVIPRGFTGRWQNLTAMRKFFAVFKPG